MTPAMHGGSPRQSVDSQRSSPNATEILLRDIIAQHAEKGDRSENGSAAGLHRGFEVRTLEKDEKGEHNHRSNESLDQG